MTHFETLQVHAGQEVDPTTKSRAQPIYSTTSYVFDNSQNAADAFALRAPSYVYARLANPTAKAFEDRVAALEGGVAAVSAASGQAAQFLVLSALASAGQSIVSASELYGGTYNLLKVNFKRIGVDVRFVPLHDFDAWEKAIDDTTRALYVDSIANPGSHVPDFERLSALAHRHGIPLVVDNTFGGGGYIVRPFDHGADICVHSATKWIGGHGNTIGGVAVDSGKFDWTKHAEKFPQLTGPSEAYHGLVFTEKFGNAAFAAYLRLEYLRDFGPTLNPFGAFLLMQGLETLSLRLDRHAYNATKLAEYFKGNENIKWVSYLGDPEHDQHALAKKYFTGHGFGSMVLIGVKPKDNEDKSAAVVDKLQLASNLANVGDAKTLVIAPFTTTHSQLTEEERIAAGATPDMIRISVGIEHIDDIIADFEQAFEKVYKN